MPFNGQIFGQIGQTTSRPRTAAEAKRLQVALAKAPGLVAVLVQARHLAVLHRPVLLAVAAAKTGAEDRPRGAHRHCQLDPLRKAPRLGGRVAGEDELVEEVIEKN